MLLEIICDDTEWPSESFVITHDFSYIYITGNDNKPARCWLIDDNQSNCVLPSNLKPLRSADIAIDFDPSPVNRNTALFDLNQTRTEFAIQP